MLRKSIQFRLFLLSGIFLFPIVSKAQKMATVTIIITNSSKAQGTVNAFLWDNAEKFPKSKKEHFGMRTAIAGTDSLQLIFNEVPFGKYAISVFCDENENKEFDRSLLRGTSEPFALSGQPDYNNPPIKFNDCSFMVDSGFHCIHLKLLFQKDLDNIRDSIQKMDGK